MNLPAALHFALEHAPSFDSARRNATIGALESKNAIAKLMPSADFTTTDGLQNQSPNALNTPWTSQLNLSLSENIYDNGESWTKHHIADTNREVQALSYLKAREQLAFDVAKEFYNYSLNSKLIEVTRQQYTTLQRQFASLSAQYRAGLKPQKDFLRFKAQVQRSEINLLTAENNVRTSRIELQRLLGIDVLDPAETNQPAPDFTPIEPGGIEQVPKVAPPYHATFDFRIAELQRQIDQATENLTKRKVWPELYATSTVSYQYSNFLNIGTDGGGPSSNLWTWNALLTLKYNIWDFGTRRRDADIAEHQREISNNKVRDGLLKVQSEMEKVMRQLEKGEADYRLARELLKLSIESFNFIDEEYRRGKVSYLDITNSLDELLDAKTRFYTAYFGLLQAIAGYRYYEGKLYESLAEK